MPFASKALNVQNISKVNGYQNVNNGYQNSYNNPKQIWNKNEQRINQGNNHIDQRKGGLNKNTGNYDNLVNRGNRDIVNMDIKQTYSCCNHPNKKGEFTGYMQNEQKGEINIFCRSCAAKLAAQGV